MNQDGGQVMRKLLLASASAIAIASVAPAYAADLPTKGPIMAPIAAPIPFTWTGLYVGANVGWGNSRFKTQGFLSDGDPTSYNTLSSNVSGLIFGGQLGYNWQFAPQWVLGIEGQIEGSSMNGFGLQNGCCQLWAKTDALASVTGKLGWTGWDPRQMIYVKGGWAWAKNETMFSYALSTTHNRNGWTIGGGWEWSPVITPNWSFFVEYQYYDFGTKNQSNCFSNDTTCSTVDVKQTVNTVKVGTNYRFNFGR
jgi:outer membrane immunogenic protein